MMKLCSCTISVLIALPSGLLRAQVAPPAPAQVEAPQVPRPRMNIAVISGEGAINNVRLKQGTQIVVQVRDGNRRPVPGAKVTFTAPESGPSGLFQNNNRIYETTTDNDGRATSRFTPSTETGTVNIAVAAEGAGDTAAATITQFNMYVPRGGGGGGAGKWVAIIGLIGAAAAGGAAYALSRDNNGTTGRPPTPIGITPGSGAVGAPR